MDLGEPLPVSILDATSYFRVSLFCLVCQISELFRPGYRIGNPISAITLWG